MPIPYLDKIVNRLGSNNATLFTQSIGIDSNYGIVDETTTILTEISQFNYFEIPIDRKIRQMVGGWIDDVELVIWVSTTLDISKRKGYNADIVDIGGEKFMVIATKTTRFLNHSYLVVGLMPQEEGVLYGVP